MKNRTFYTKTYDSICDSQHLLKQGLFLLMTSTCIDNDEFKPFLFKHLHTFLRDHNRIDFSVTAIKWNSGFCRILFNLIVRSRTKSIGTHKT